MDDPVTDPAALQAALVRRLDRRVNVQGEISLPCAPSLLELYVKRLAVMFASFGKAFTREELANLRELLAPRLKDGFAKSPHCRIRVVWESQEWPATGLDYKVKLDTATVADQYEHWAATKEPPLFGVHADAMALEAAATLGDPAGAPILDVGAGTGRNSLPLARLGHPVDAVEIAPSFAKTIRETAAEQGLRVHTIEADVLGEGADAVEPDRYAMVLVSEVCSHLRGPAELRRLFERASGWLRPGGQLVINAFVTVPGYVPTDAARELAEVFWSAMYTPDEVRAATEGLPLVPVADEPANAFERARQPDWPPTGWFQDWSRGYDVWGVVDGRPPMELRWLLWRKA